MINTFLIPIKVKYFSLLLLFNLISGLAYYNTSNSSFFVLFSILAIAFAVAYLESVLLLPFNKVCRKFLLTIVVLVYNLLIISDYYCRYKFGKVLGQDIIDILAETNPTEISNFISTYLTFNILVSIIIIVIIFNWVVVLTASLIRKTKYTFISFILSILGFGIWGYMLYSFLLYRNGNSIPQYHVLTRVGYAVYITQQRSKKIKHLCVVAKDLKCEQMGRKHSFIVVIGESHSVYHSSLFGYRINNQPYLKKYKDSGELVLFEDVVSSHDHTHSALQSLFSMDYQTTDFENQPLFPMCFKACGYHTELWSNQYGLGGINFLSDRDLSNAMFDKRNDRMYKYDEELINEIEVNDSASLYVIHLWGQHYDYDQRYPKEFDIIKPEQYANFGEKHAKVLAAYDNATIYNDYVMNKIVEKFKDSDACLIYLSDHGEEIYDIDDYMGHGNAHTRNPQYQVRIPLFVFPFKKFKENEPELIERIKKYSINPMAQDDFCHFLLDIAGIRNKWYDETRSAVNPKYKKRDRIVLNSVNYDKEKIK